MNQNFKFSSKNSKLNILNGIKTYTTRKLSDYRKKCNKNDLMHCFDGDGYFYKKEQKFAITFVLGTFTWNQSNLDNIISPGELSIFNISWHNFAIAEGFDNLKQLIDYFTQERYIGEELKTFHFRVMEIINPRTHCIYRYKNGHCKLLRKELGYIHSCVKTCNGYFREIKSTFRGY